MFYYVLFKDHLSGTINTLTSLQISDGNHWIDFKLPVSILMEGPNSQNGWLPKLRKYPLDLRTLWACCNLFSTLNLGAWEESWVTVLVFCIFTQSKTQGLEPPWKLNCQRKGQQGKQEGVRDGLRPSFQMTSVHDSSLWLIWLNGCQPLPSSPNLEKEVMESDGWRRLYYLTREQNLLHP